MIRAVLKWVEKPGLSWRLVVLVLILGAPALWIGFVIDDYAHRGALLGKGPTGEAFPSPFHLFSFLDGDPETTERLIEWGLMPWWTSKTASISFWRPVTAFTHWIDHQLWPNAPMLMHLQSLLWYVGLVVLATLFYARIGPSAAVAGLAALIFAVDESHAFTMGWLANRNIGLAAFWGVACLLCHDRWRAEGRNVFAAFAVLALVVSVHANEGGISTTAYLFAYALFVDKTPLRSRILALVPYAVVIVAWRVYYNLLGFGAEGSPLYTDPVREPLRFVESLVMRAPAYLAGQWLNFPMESQVVTGRANDPVIWTVLVLIAVGIAWVMRRTFFASDQSRFWLTGMALSVVPACATIPSNRMLVFVSLGGAGLLAQFIHDVYANPRWFQAPAKWASKGFVAIHLVLAPLTMVGTFVGLAFLARLLNDSVDNATFPDDISERTALIVNSPTYFATGYLTTKLDLDGRPVPKRLYTLSPNSFAVVPITVTRTGDRTVRFVPEGGYPILFARKRDEPFQKGDRIALPGLNIVIVRVDDKGKALEVDYTFEKSLDDPEYYWIETQNLEYRQFKPPAVGETVVLNAE